MISSFYEKIVGGSPPPETNEPRILCVGNPCLDIVHVCKHYPVEDSDERYRTHTHYTHVSIFIQDSIT